MECDIVIKSEDQMSFHEVSEYFKEENLTSVKNFEQLTSFFELRKEFI